MYVRLSLRSVISYVVHLLSNAKCSWKFSVGQHRHIKQEWPRSIRRVRAPIVAVGSSITYFVCVSGCVGSCVGVRVALVT
jgi:hypothetical protein